MHKLKAIFIGGAIFWASCVKAQVPGSAIDVLHYGFDITLTDANNTIKGKANVTVRFLRDAQWLSLNLVKKNSGKGMLVSAVAVNNKPVSFEQDNNELVINYKAVKHSKVTFAVTYAGIPADGLIISTNKYKQRTFFGDNWPDRAQNWLPCVDDPADKAAVDFMVTAPAHYTVVSNGLKVAEDKLPGNKKFTHWREKAALATKIMVIGVAKFAVQHSGTVDGVPIFSYVFPKNTASGFKNYGIANKVLPFFIEKIGPFPYKKLANVQSKTIFGGMENAGAIFYYEDSAIEKNVEALVAHEVAHQWFGDSASEKNFANLWLSEGFATYLTHYYLESKYGVDSLNKRLRDDRKKIFEFEKKRFKPIVDTTIRSDYMTLLNPNSYEKGAWVLHMMRRRMGDANFWKGIRAYYAKYAGGNAGTEDFRLTMEQAIGRNLQGFFKQWLYMPGHPYFDIVWKYDEGDQEVNITITQKQHHLYRVPLDLAIDGKVQTFRIGEKQTVLKVKANKRPNNIVADPNTNLLASFAVSGI